MGCRCSQPYYSSNDGKNKILVNKIASSVCRVYSNENDISKFALNRENTFGKGRNGIDVSSYEKWLFSSAQECEEV
jgi:hypothetical protein